MIEPHTINSDDEIENEVFSDEEQDPPQLSSFPNKKKKEKKSFVFEFDDGEVCYYVIYGTSFCFTLYLF